MKSNGCKSRTAKASEQAGSESCHSPGDWWVRSVDSKEAGREGSAPKSFIVAMPTLLVERKAASGYDRNCEGRPGIAGVPSSGMFPKGFPMNPGELPISARKSGKTAAKGNRRRSRTDGRAVLRPYSTCEGGDPQGFRKERPRYPLEGRGEQGDVSVEGNISETQNSRNYVHRTRQNI